MRKGTFLVHGHIPLLEQCLEPKKYLLNEGINDERRGRQMQNFPFPLAEALPGTVVVTTGWPQLPLPSTVGHTPGKAFGAREFCELCELLFF